MPIERLLRAEHVALQAREPNPQFGDPLAAGAPKPQPGPYLEVPRVATGLATLYERLRNTLDFRDEHLIRVYAIRRILKRRMVRGVEASKVATPLLQELIRSGYIDAASVPESALPGYEALVLKYIQLFHFLLVNHGQHVESKVWDWVFLLAANELEEKLVPAQNQHLLFDRLIETIEQENVFGRWQMDAQEKRRQITIAVYRMILKLNNELISWRLFKRIYPHWTQGVDADGVAEAAQALPALKFDIEQAMRNPSSDRLSRAIKPVTTTLWLVLQGLRTEEDKPFVLEHPEQLKKLLSETVQEHYKEARRRLRRALWRSLMYIFITKMALALLVEVPTDRFFMGNVNIFNIAFTILMPLLLLLIFGLSVRVPGTKNTAQILSLAETLVYDGKLGIEQLRAPAGHRVLLSRLFNLFYSIIYIVSFGAIVLFLLRLHFTVVGIFLFLFFLSIVSFFGFRIREQAQELIVTKGQEGFLVFLPVLFFLPILRTGRWISQQSSKINIFLYFFDLFIEAPLQTFLEFFDQFSKFVREKREDITN